jgi:CBS domain containing-hemolysin-like protein
MDKDEIKNLIKQSKQKEKSKKEMFDLKWVLLIVGISFTLSIIMSLISQAIIPHLNIILGIFVTLVFVFIGILFDIIGVSVTSADENVFHSMSSRKVFGASRAVSFKKNSEKVSSFCCDVVGDICGIISGACGGTIALLISNTFGYSLIVVGLLVTATIASLTIGGKAIGKSIAINNSNVILFRFAKFISYFHK